MESTEKHASNKINEVAKKNMSQWLGALSTEDPQKVSDMYAEDAIFLPTLSGDLKRGQDGAKEYFEHFLAKKPEGKIIKEVVMPLGDGVYSHAGMYDFEVDGEEGRTTVNARFDYIWKKSFENKWEIVLHHSSLQPE